MTTIGGIDEAGRGCIVGDLIITGITIEESTLDSWRRVGVKDSKRLSPKRREVLCGLLTKHWGITFHTITIPPPEIDVAVMVHKLNRLEAVNFAKVADALKADKFYVDSPDRNCTRFSNIIYNLSNSKPDVVAENKADSTYTVVGAASIIAKVTRDREVAKLREKHGDFGSGYPSDRRTREFLTELVNRTGKIPDYCRRSWSSWQRWTPQIERFK